MAILDALRHSPLRILLLDLGANTIVVFKSLLELSDPIVNLFSGFIYFGKCQLVVLFSFLVLKFEVSSLSGLFESLILLPILHTLL